MVDGRRRVLVVGAGPAGLAAAERLVDQGRGRLRVRLATLGHNIGGKASSWRDAEGRLIDHGLHVIIGFYDEMRALLRRSGVDPEARLCSNQGHTHVWEERDGKLHDLALKRNPLHVLSTTTGYTGFTAKELAGIVRFVLGNPTVWFGPRKLEDLDDVCFTAWALSAGCPPSVVRTRAFQMSRQGQLNWPGEISAYSLLRALREMARDYKTVEYGFCDGGMSERFWTPVLERVASLGGEYEMMRQLVGLRHDGRRVTGALFAEPDPAGHERSDHPHGKAVFEGPVPSKPGTVFVDEDFDEIITTLPAAAFQQLNPGDRAFWSLPGFEGIPQLRSVCPLAAQLWHREPVTRTYHGVIGGLDGPLHFVLDTRHIVREYRFNPRYGSVLYFVGQEAGFESASDEDLLDRCLRNLPRLPGYERITAEGVLHFAVVRTRAFHQRYFLTDPGSLRLRPFMRTALDNLFLAGDWVRGELDFPCMEAAIRSGRAAADAVLGRLR